MNPIFLLQGIGMLAVALLAVVVWRRRSGISVAFFVWGGLSWLVAIILKSLASAPLPTIIPRLRALVPDVVSEPLLWLFVGLLTGVFECGLALLIVSRVRRLRSATWSEALGYGLGFGAFEAVVLGISSFVIILLTITAPDQVPTELVDVAAASEASLLAIPVPIVERSIVILLHAFSSLLIIYAVQAREWTWFWVSFFYKTAMDTIAGAIQITYGVENLSLGGAWLVELVLLPFGLIGLWGLWAFRYRWQSQEARLD